MTKEILAQQINGNSYGDEVPKEIELAAKDAGLIIIFGYSDDNVEFRGAIHDEIGCYEGGIVYITRNKVLPNHEDCECEFCGFENVQKNAAKIEANWGMSGYSWFIDTALPNAPFDIMEEGQKFCRGIVIDRNDITPF